MDLATIGSENISKILALIGILGATLDLVFILPVLKNRFHTLGLWFILVAQGYFSISILQNDVWMPIDKIIIVQSLSTIGWIIISTGYFKVTYNFWRREFSHVRNCKPQNHHS